MCSYISKYWQENTCVGASLLEAWRPETLLKRGYVDRCFPVNIAKCLRTAILKSIFEQMLLQKLYQNSGTENIKSEQKMYNNVKKFKQCCHDDNLLSNM